MLRLRWLLCWVLMNVSLVVAKEHIATLPTLTYGNVRAKTRVIAFQSMDCSACEQFDQEEFPRIMQDYVHPQKIYWIRISLPVDIGDVLMLAYMRYLPEDKLFEAEVWYKQFRQNATYPSEEAFKAALHTELKAQFPEVAERINITEDDIDAVIKETLRLVETYGLSEYPTFKINDQLVKRKVLDKVLQKINTQ